MLLLQLHCSKNQSVASKQRKVVKKVTYWYGVHCPKCGTLINADVCQDCGWSINPKITSDRVKNPLIKKIGILIAVIIGGFIAIGVVTYILLR